MTAHRTDPRRWRAGTALAAAALVVGLAAPPAVAAEKPAVKQKSAAKPAKIASRSEGTAPRKPVQPLSAAHKPRGRTLVMLCTGFRTYNASSGTYRGYDGRTYSCR